MSVQMMLAPVFVLVLATIVLAFLDSRAAPQAERGVGGMAGSFQLTILYCVMVALALPLKQLDLLLLLLGWVFVVLQILGGLVVFGAEGSGRFYTFAASAIVLFAMWVVFALKLFLALAV